MLKEGQTLFLEVTDPNAVRRGTSGNIIEVTVTEVKRKYFKVIDANGSYTIEKARFFVDGMRHEGGQNHSMWKAYFTKEEIENSHLSTKLESLIKGKFTHSFHKLDISLVKLKQIAEILEIYDPYTKSIVDEKA